MNVIQYKGYIGAVEFDSDLDAFHGRVINIRDVVSFYGESAAELKAEMKKSVDVYIEFCEEKGIDPAKPYSGRLNLRATPELHAKLAAAAAREGRSLNEWAIAHLADAA